MVGEESDTLLWLVPPGKEEPDRHRNSLPPTAAKKKHTQPTLGQLGQAVNGINTTSQDAAEHNNTGSPS